MTENAQKKQILDAVLDHVMFDGWSDKAIKAAAKDLSLDPFILSELFPKGAIDLIAYFVENADDQMEAALIEHDALSLKIRERITLAVRLRLEMYAPYREAVRNALTLMALPQNAPRGLKLTAGTVSRMWYATGDTSTDYNYYTKRLTLSVVYTSTLLYWLDDPSENSAKTWGFLDRRIENVMQFETAKFKMKKFFSEKPKGPDFPSAKRFFRNLNAR